MTVPRHPHLFTPVQIGPIILKHRVVMAPLTRSRSEQPGGHPGPSDARILHAASFRRRLHRLRGDLGIAHGSRVAWSTRSLLGPTGRRMEENHSRRPCEGRPHVLAAVAYGTLFARRDGRWPHAGFGFRRTPTCLNASGGDCRSTITTATRSTPSTLTVIQTTRSTTCARPHSFLNVNRARLFAAKTVVPENWRGLRSRTKSGCVGPLCRRAFARRERLASGWIGCDDVRSHAGDWFVTFDLTPDGTATALVLHVNGKTRRALRLP
jgi:hypothetical protein